MCCRCIHWSHRHLKRHKHKHTHTHTHTHSLSLSHTHTHTRTHVHTHSLMALAPLKMSGQIRGAVSSQWGGWCRVKGRPISSILSWAQIRWAKTRWATALGISGVAIRLLWIWMLFNSAKLRVFVAEVLKLLEKPGDEAFCFWGSWGYLCVVCVCVCVCVCITCIYISMMHVCHTYKWICAIRLMCVCMLCVYYVLSICLSIWNFIYEISSWLNIGHICVLGGWGGRVIKPHGTFSQVASALLSSRFATILFWSFYMYVCVYLSISIYQSIYLSLSIYLYLYLSIISIYLSVCLSFYLSRNM